MTSTQVLTRSLTLALTLACAMPTLAQEPASEATATATDAAATGDAAADADAAAAASAEPAPDVAAESETVAPDAPPAPAPSVRSETMPLVASQALILDFAEATSRAIAVGERGQVLLSESRNDWRQASDVPTRANLNAVATVGDLAWAVGQDGTIIHSADGGQTWTVQRSDPWRPLGDDEEFNPRQGMPLLDVLMLDAQRGIAIGAYSLLLRTEDGGQTWTELSINGGGAVAEEAIAQADEAAVDPSADPASDAAATGDDNWTFDQSDLELEEESDPHLNAIARTGDGSLFIVAERGAAYRSRDDGQTWERLQLPYEGSMFGVIGYEGQRVLAFGMRGNAFESNDLGANWTTVDTGTQLSLMGGTALPDGGAALVGANGVVVVRANASAPLTLHTFETKAQETPVLAGVLAQSASQLVVSGEKGVGSFSVPAPAAQ
jgi:photosystem II stability/assembly factor-like uncharacterized protein